MGLVSKQVLPTIDFSEAGLTPGSLVWNSVRSQVHEALVKYGCFEACFNKVELELKKSTIEAVKELFDRPSHTKLKNLTKNPYRGYFGQNSKFPLFESMSIEDPTGLQSVQAYTHLFWPEGNSIFCKAIQSFSEKLSELDEMVRKMVLESLGVEKYFDEHINSTEYLLRMMNHKAPVTTDPVPDLNSHTNTNIVTILYQDQNGGLEVQTRDGEWIDVKPASFVVMIGDSLHAWTNGRLHSPMMRGSEARCSLGLFSIPKAGYIIKVPEELVDEEHPLLFKPFDQGEYFSFYFSEAGKKAKYPLAAYCGVN